MKNVLKKYGKVEEEVDLKNITSYRLNEKAKVLVTINDIEKLKQLIIYLKENNINHKIIGGCSNLIFDGYYDGVLIKLDLKKLKINNTLVEVESGYNLMALALKTANLGLTGLEFASGIPGTIGGAVYNNSGAYKSDMGYIVKKVEVLNPNLEIETLENKDLNYHYRTSIFKENPNYIILKAYIKLEKGNKKEILDIIKDRKIRRLETQPLEYPSAGSVFRNPTGLFAGKLIEDVGYKGKNVGDAYVSEKHANFIINKGNANGKDVVKLINEIKEKVKKQFDVDLILEQEIVK